MEQALRRQEADGSLPRAKDIGWLRMFKTWWLTEP